MSLFFRWLLLMLLFFAAGFSSFRDYLRLLASPSLPRLHWCHFRYCCLFSRRRRHYLFFMLTKFRHCRHIIFATLTLMLRRYLCWCHCCYSFSRQEDYVILHDAIIISPPAAAFRRDADIASPAPWAMFSRIAAAIHIAVLIIFSHFVIDISMPASARWCLITRSMSYICLPSCWWHALIISLFHAPAAFFALPLIIRHAFISSGFTPDTCRVGASPDYFRQYFRHTPCHTDFLRRHYTKMPRLFRLFTLRLYATRRHAAMPHAYDASAWCFHWILILRLPLPYWLRRFAALPLSCRHAMLITLSRCSLSADIRFIDIFTF